MTISTTNATTNATKNCIQPSLSWLHCNQCFRSFEHHNRISFDLENPASGKLIRSDLIFSFTSCGHFLCQNCIQQYSIATTTTATNTITTPNSDLLQCPVCKEEKVETFPVDQDLQPSFLMYLKSPLSLLEDSLSIMSFQQSNAIALIKNLRLKVSQQKETLGKAKQELSTHKILKTKNNELSEQNSLLHRRLDDVTRVCRTKSPPPPQQYYNHRSPIRKSSYNSNNNLQQQHHHQQKQQQQPVTPTRLSLKSPKTTSKTSQFSQFSYNPQNQATTTLLPPLYYGGGVSNVSGSRLQQQQPAQQRQQPLSKPLFLSPTPSPSPSSFFNNMNHQQQQQQHFYNQRLHQTPQNTSITSSPLLYQNVNNTNYLNNNHNHQRPITNQCRTARKGNFI